MISGVDNSISALGMAPLTCILSLFIAAAILAGCMAEEDGVVGAPGGEATWDNVALAFQAEGCAGCHGGSPPPLDNCSGLTGAGTGSNGNPYVDPGNPATSLVYQIANGDYTSSLPGTPDMTFGASDNVTLLSDWITAGAGCS